MYLAEITALLAFAPRVPEGQQPDPTAQLLQMLGMFAFMAVVFYLVLIRPQQKKAREHAALVQSLKPGDKVVTSGGILGVVVNVKDKTLSIRSADTKFEILKSSVSEITDKASTSS